LRELDVKRLDEEFPKRYQSELLRQDGRTVPVEACLSRTTYRGEDAIVCYVRDITEQKRWETDILELKEDLRMFARRILKIQEEERRHLARELHDTTTQELLVIHRQLQDLIGGSYGRLPNRASQRLANIQAFVERIADEVRGYIMGLRPTMLDDMGLIPTLRWLTKRMTSENGLLVRFGSTGQDRRLAPDVELTLFRVAQEALTNVRKHAEAVVATVIVNFDNAKVTMAVSDGGCGFEVPTTLVGLAGEGKFGLLGISERVQAHGGSLRIESKGGKGTTVDVEIPV